MSLGKYLFWGRKLFQSLNKLHCLASSRSVCAPKHTAGPHVSNGSNFGSYLVRLIVWSHILDGFPCIVQKLQCGECGEGPGGSKEDVLPWQQDQLPDENAKFSMDIY